MKAYFATAKLKLLKSVQNVGSILTDEQMSKFPERFPTFHLEPLFVFFIAIGLFEKKITILCSQVKF